MNNLAALVLAGGAARRMGGGDKPLLDLGGRPMLAHVLAALRFETGLIALSANGDPARFAQFGLPVLDDGNHAGEGPLAGLRAGLAWAESEGATALLTAPGDTPFLPTGLAATLAPPPACVLADGRIHPTIALWPVACLGTLRQFLAGPSRRMLDFTAAIGMRHVPFADAAAFRNINTPEELAAARTVIR